MEAIFNKMKVKISKKQQKEIAKFKKLIDSHRKKEDKLFEGLIASLHVTDEQAEIIWDYIYNDTKLSIEFKA
jgi:nitrogen fixation/metabolism regulation signal transduction histidine kinase